MSDFSYIRLTSAGAKRSSRVFSKPIQYRFEIWAFWTVILELPEASEVDLGLDLQYKKAIMAFWTVIPPFRARKPHTKNVFSQKKYARCIKPENYGDESFFLGFTRNRARSHPTRTAAEQQKGSPKRPFQSAVINTAISSPRCTSR